MTRRGATLAELLVVLATGGLLVAAAVGSLTAGQRSSRAAAEVRAARAELREVITLLRSELRGVASTDTLRLAADTAVEFFAPVVSAVTCAPSTDGRLLLSALPPRRPAGRSIIPDTGDVAWVWTADTLASRGRWVRTGISGYSEPVLSGCDPDLAPLQARGRVLTLSSDPGPIGAGAPVQVVRRGRYSVYRSSDGAWYLGYRRCDALGASRCQTIQPVAGPLRARSGAVAGIEFRYFDSAGAELVGAAAAAATRIELLVRTDTARAESRAPRRAALDDSLAATISFRNAF